MGWFIDHPGDLEIVKEIENPELPDRLVAIVATAFLDERLKSRIEGWLVADRDAARKLTKPSGPLGSFGPRVDVGYSLGMYGKVVRDDLLKVGELRNAFAHSASKVTFEGNEIKSKVEELRLINEVAHNGWLYGGRTITESIMVGGPELVPGTYRGRFLTTVRLLFVCVSLQGPQRPSPPTI